MRRLIFTTMIAFTVLATSAQETPPSGTVQATTSTSYIAPGSQIWGRYSGAGVAAFYTKLVRDKDLKDSLAALNNKFILNNPPTPQPGNIKLKYGQITIARPDDESLNAVQLYSGGGLTLGSANGSATLVAGQTISLSTPSSTTNINPDQVTSGGTDGSFRLAKDMVTGSTTSTGSGFILQPTNIIMRKSGSVSRGLVIPNNATGNHVLYPPNKTDTVATVSDFIPYQLKTEKGAANGYAPLDGAGKVPLANINDALLGAVNYRGTYDASANTPALPSASTSNKGYYYIVSTAGTQFGLTFRIGDWIISNGSAYGKVSSSSDVESVNGQKGVVVLNSSDISGVVDLTTSQTISGVKSFENGINISSGSTMRAALGDSYSSVDASGLTAGETSTSIFSTLQKDEVIYNKGANKLHVKAPTTITGEITQSFQNKSGTVAYMDDVATKANDADVVKVLGNQNIDNAKTFIGNIYVPTRSNATNNQEAASTAFVWNKIASKADLSGATFGGSIVANAGINASSIGITGNLDVNGTSNFNGQTNVPNAPTTADNSKTAANTKFVQDRLGSGQTIGANTTGSAATSIQWNGQENDFSTYGTTLSYLIGKDSPTNKTKPFNPTQIKSWLNINDGSALNNTALGAINWGGKQADFNTVGGTVGTFLGIDNASGIAKPYSPTSIKSQLGINDGSTLNNDVPRWSGQYYDGTGTISNANLTYVMTYNNDVGKWTYNPLNYLKAKLATTLQDVASVGNQTNSTLYITDGVRPTTPTGKTIGIEYSSDRGSIFAYDYSNSTPQNLVLQIPGGNVGIGKTPTQRLDVNGTTKITRASGSISVMGDADLVIDGGIPGTDSPVFINAYGIGNTILNQGGGSVGIGTASPSERLDVNGNIKANNISSGTYTPTFTNGANTTNATGTAAHYIRFGNQVTVYGTVTATLTSGTSNSSVTITLPIPSAITATTDITGYGSTNTGSYNPGVAITGDVSNTRANLLINAYSSAGTGISVNVPYSFMYTIK